MLNVGSRFLFFICAFCALLVGCKSPDLDVSSLDRRLPAPSLKGSSPFNQDFDSQNYARVQGNCDSRVGNLFISFDKQVWHQPPLTPDISGTSLPAGLTNDRDCTDGSFDIYLTKNDLQNIWGIQTGSGGTDVNYIYIKGETLIGDTDILTLIDTKNPNNPGSSAPATKMSLEKNWPQNNAAADRCSNFHVSLQTATGTRGVATNNVTFSIEEQSGGGVTTAITGYANWDDCNQGINAKTVFTVPAGSDGVEVIYKFPVYSGTSTSFSYRLTNTSLTADLVYTIVNIHDSSAATMDRWLGSTAPLHQIYKNICYQIPISAFSYQYNQQIADPIADAGFSVSSIDPNLKFYNGSGCTTEISTFSLANVLSANVYVKYKTSTVGTSGFKATQVVFIGAASNYLHYDPFVLNLNIDLNDGQGTVTRVDIWGPQNVKVVSCQPFNIATTNNNGTSLSVTTEKQVFVAMQEANAGTFYTDPTCETAISSVYVGSPTTQIYYKAPSLPGTYHFSISSPGLTSSTRAVNVQ